MTPTAPAIPAATTDGDGGGPIRWIILPRAKLAKLQAMGTKALDIIEESLSHHNL